MGCGMWGMGDVHTKLWERGQVFPLGHPHPALGQQAAGVSPPKHGIWGSGSITLSYDQGAAEMPFPYKQQHMGQWGYSK